MTPPIDPNMWLSEVTAVAAAARRGKDPEAVHRLRVAIEHLRVWIVLAKRHEPRDDLGWVRRRMASVRDIDVHLALDPPDAVAALLRAERVHALRRLRRALRSDRFANAIAALRSIPPVPRATAKQGAARLARRTLERGERLGRRRRDWASLHALRRALRRTRYALEWLDEPSTPLAALQRLLGDVCDRRALVERLERLERLGVEEHRYRRQLERACDAYTDVVLVSWPGVRSELNELRRAVRS